MERSSIFPLDKLRPFDCLPENPVEWRANPAYQFSRRSPTFASPLKMRAPEEAAAGFTLKNDGSS
jgi:hypothetical protein